MLFFYVNLFVVNLNVIIVYMYIFVKFDCKDLKQYDFPYGQ